MKARPAMSSFFACCAVGVVALTVAACSSTAVSPPVDASTDASADSNADADAGCVCGNLGPCNLAKGEYCFEDRSGLPHTFYCQSYVPTDAACGPTPVCGCVFPAPVRGGGFTQTSCTVDQCGLVTLAGVFGPL